eukprot:CAMPEP_0172205454 /NCGR_PEP_ID=MMETSP1050-20130122/32622_1 /TAXON_ID=233186 /ORGANISM="Cryptomonas curvata, Strain CCAP979/52" /LENGTH=38 /DNA_ID= /DNA_START= /DNA_END= /DNA_ORIENTATION=
MDPAVKDKLIKENYHMKTCEELGFEPPVDTAPHAAERR